MVKGIVCERSAAGDNWKKMKRNYTDQSHNTKFATTQDLYKPCTTSVSRKKSCKNNFWPILLTHRASYRISKTRSRKYAHATKRMEAWANSSWGHSWMHHHNDIRNLEQNYPDHAHATTFATRHRLSKHCRISVFQEKQLKLIILDFKIENTLHSHYLLLIDFSSE